MARARHAASPPLSEPFRAEPDEFLPESEVFPNGPVIVTVGKDEDWESLFLPEQPERPERPERPDRLARKEAVDRAGEGAPADAAWINPFLTLQNGPTEPLRAPEVVRRLGSSGRHFGAVAAMVVLGLAGAVMITRVSMMPARETTARLDTLAALAQPAADSPSDDGGTHATDVRGGDVTVRPTGSAAGLANARTPASPTLSAIAPATSRPAAASTPSGPAASQRPPAARDVPPPVTTTARIAPPSSQPSAIGVSAVPPASANAATSPSAPTSSTIPPSAAATSSGVPPATSSPSPANTSPRPAAPATSAPVASAPATSSATPPSIASTTPAPSPTASTPQASAPPSRPVASAQPAPVRTPPPSAAAASAALRTSPPAAPPPSSSPAAANAVATDRAAIETALGRYRSAFASLDVNQVQAVWPTVNSRALASAFDQLQEQSFAFEDCAINVNGVLAEAVCRGSARFVPSVGSRNPRIEPRRWTFHFVRAGTGWRMERVESRSGS